MGVSSCGVSSLGEERSLVGCRALRPMHDRKTKDLKLGLDRAARLAMAAKQTGIIKQSESSMEILEQVFKP